MFPHGASGGEDIDRYGAQQAEREKAEDLARTIRGMADEGIDGSTTVIPRSSANNGLRKLKISEFRSSAPEKPVSVGQYVKDELLDEQPGLKDNSCKPSGNKGKVGTDDNIIDGLIKDLEDRLKFISP